MNCLHPHPHIFHLAHEVLDNVQPRAYLADPVHRVLHSCAFGILESSQSYVALRKLNYHNDCNAIARTIFERMVKTLIAQRGEREAARVLATEFAEQREKLRAWASQQPDDREALSKALAELEQRTAQLRAKFGGAEPFADDFGMVAAAGMGGVYRRFYFAASHFVHGTGWSAWDSGTGFIPGADLMVMSSALLSAQAFYSVSDLAQQRPDLQPAFSKRFEELKRALVQEP